MILNYLFNFVMFFTVLNFNWLINQGYRSTSQRELLKRVAIPLLLGTLLSAIDSMKVAFFYQLFLFGLLAVLAYVYYRLRWKRR